jgi:biopolymer transport protein ExbD
MVLQLTSLLDMFTIILVFLMVSFQAEDKDFVLHAGLELPHSSAKSPFKTGVNLAITTEGVLIEGKQVYQLDKGRAAEADHEAGKAEGITRAVAQTWSQLKREEGEEDIVVIQADRGLPYRTIHLVMRSAAYAGAYRFRLVVEKE